MLRAPPDPLLSPPNLSLPLALASRAAPPSLPQNRSPLFFHFCSNRFCPVGEHYYDNLEGEARADPDAMILPLWPFPLFLPTSLDPHQN